MNLYYVKDGQFFSFRRGRPPSKKRLIFPEKNKDGYLFHRRGRPPRQK